MSTVITVEGNLTADPTHTRVPAAGTDGEGHADGSATVPVTNLRIAVSDRYRDDTGNWVSSEPVFHDVAVWGAAAIHVANTFRTGDRVLVHGTHRVRSWTGNDGVPRTTSTITAAMIGASVRYVVAQLPRRAPASSTTAGHVVGQPLMGRLAPAGQPEQSRTR